MPRQSWHLVTGEYAPAPGGVAAYARAVARELAVAGDDVHVWAPPLYGALVTDPGVRLHPLVHGYGPRGLAWLSQAIGRTGGRPRILVQYVPNAFGGKGMNIPFSVWIRSLRSAEVWVMFHEVAVARGTLRQWKQNIVSSATRYMARSLVRRADRVFVSIPFWAQVLQDIAPRWVGSATWLPVPSNVPTSASATAGWDVRSRLSLPARAEVIGHFGTYGAHSTPLLRRAFRELLGRDVNRVALLIGHESDRFARDLLAERGMTGRVIATGSLDSGDVIAGHLLACDVLVQPYGDGLSSRRTSAMAGLALGVPTVTNAGPVTESIWRECDAVELASSIDGVVELAEALLRDRARAASLGERGRRLYQRRFSIERTIDVLRSPFDGP